ncbi:response regulator [Roseomonas sp. GC11]|uniref:hybrid sensor histidine kinase/response regulator n=1 Tax=Roseomonas sp. GC11 TaxID=2950546 RepID=UPI00210BAD55|nr:response regulator [Roseomonas sp. GC11]MCQ4162739.1 response regulator [Roseomonas sp. GC11]
MSDLRQELLAAFGIEHQEHLAAIRAALAAAARGQPFDLRDAFRRAHSLKGAARAVDLPVVEDLAHRLEAVFSRIGEGALALDAAAIAGVRAGLDGIETYVAALPEGKPPVAARAALEALLPGAPPPAPGPLPADPGSGLGFPGPASAPPVEAAPAGAGDYLRVPAAQMEALTAAVQALAAPLARQEGVEHSLRALEGAMRALRRDWEALARLPTLANPTLANPAAAGRMRDFGHDLAGLSRRLGQMARAQRAAAWATEGAAAALRRQVERIALVPAEAVLGPLARMAGTLAREAGHEARILAEGLELQADRRLLQALKDPVTHLLRNAVGHGLEGAARRARQGKPPEAEIALRLEARGGLLVIRVQDDGPGPDLARIEATALRAGLLPPRAPGQPPPPAEHLLALVFEPGFSTAPAVDRLSGRGMGLSVVAEVARAWRGGATLRPRQPWGTEVEIAVPLSAARLPLLLVEAGGRAYGLPGHGVERLLRQPAAAITRAEGQPVLRIESGGRDVIAPVVALSALLGEPAAPIPVEAGHVKAVLLRGGERRCAVAVEAFHDVRVLTVEAVDAPGVDAALVAGLALREGEAPVLVLSPEGLVGRWLREAGQFAAPGIGISIGIGPAAVPEARPAATILVVDDSITTRTLEKSILEAQGFRVLLSVDGLDALALLRAGEAVVDLVIADVEMPRMDGFALLQAMKTDPRLAPIPVILMTSRADPQDVRRGLELGAGAYITKQKFDQRELLATIGQML